MTIRNVYGTIELNPITPEQMAAQRAATESVCWTTPGLKITRLRLLSDPGFPVWDVSYCYGELDGKPVEVELPFSQLPKRKMRTWLFNEAKKTGVFINGLFSALSTVN